MPSIHYWFHFLSPFSLEPIQIGFQSTKTALVTAISDLWVAKCNGQFSVLTLLDLQAALTHLLLPRGFIWLSGHDALPAFLLPHWMVLPELLTLGIPKVQSLDCFPFLLIFIFLAIPSNLMAFNSICRQIPNFIFSSQTHWSNCILNSDV